MLKTYSMLLYFYSLGFAYISNENVMIRGHSWHYLETFASFINWYSIILTSKWVKARKPLDILSVT